MRRIRLLLAAVVLLATVPGCVTLPGMPKPDVRAVGAQVSDVDSDSTLVSFEVSVHNPYPFPIYAAKFRYGMEIGGSDFVSSGVPVGVDLPAMKTSAVTLPVRVSYLDLWDQHPGLREAAEAKYRLHSAIVLSVVGSTVELPFSHEGSFPIFRPPVVTAARVRLADVSLEEARIIVEAEMENPNVFSLEVGGLEYELDLGEVQLAVFRESTEKRIGPNQTDWLTLSGPISASNGLINLLMDGVSTIPRVSATGSVGTVYGAIRFQE